MIRAPQASAALAIEPAFLGEEDGHLLVDAREQRLRLSLAAAHERVYLAARGDQAALFGDPLFEARGEFAHARHALELRGTFLHERAERIELSGDLARSGTVRPGLALDGRLTVEAAALIGHRLRDEPPHVVGFRDDALALNRPSLGIDRARLEVAQHGQHGQLQQHGNRDE